MYIKRTSKPTIKQYVSLDFYDFTNKGVTDEVIEKILNSKNIYYEKTKAFGIWKLYIDSISKYELQYLVDDIDYCIMLESKQLKQID